MKTLVSISFRCSLLAFRGSASCFALIRLPGKCQHLKFNCWPQNTNLLVLSLPNNVHSLNPLSQVMRLLMSEKCQDYCPSHGAQNTGVKHVYLIIRQTFGLFCSGGGKFPLHVLQQFNVNPLYFCYEVIPIILWARVSIEIKGVENYWRGGRKS